MGYFGKGGITQQTKDVEITGGFHVLVGRLNKQQSDDCETILTGGAKATTRLHSRGRGNGSVADEVEQETVLTMEHRRYRTAVLVRGMRSWNLTEEDGAIAPIDEPHVNQLLDIDANTLFLAIKDFDQALTEKDLGNSDASPEMPSKA